MDKFNFDEKSQIRMKILRHNLSNGACILELSVSRTSEEVLIDLIPSQATLVSK